MRTKPEGTQKKKKSKVWIIILIILLILAGAAAGIAYYLGLGPFAELGDGGEDGEEEGSAKIIPTVTYFNGVVEPRKTVDIKKDDEREVEEIFVKEGDKVKKGDKLFSYATSDEEMDVEQAQLEYKGIQNEISGYVSQIAELKKERDKVKDSQKLEYTIQIQDLESQQKQAELSLQQKQVEIDNLKKGVGNAVVTATMKGMIKSINKDGMDDSPFMTIMATGNFQIKGTVDEMFVWYLSEGMEVTVRSRVDETQTWTGTISRINTGDMAAENTGEDDYEENEESGENQATRYYFYVTLDDADGLLIGQHVYLEPDIDPSVFEMEEESEEGEEGEDEEFDEEGEDFEDYDEGEGESSVEDEELDGESGDIGENFEVFDGEDTEDTDVEGLIRYDGFIG